MATVPASHRDLLDAAMLTIATVGPGGRPQLSVVWFLTEDDTVGVSLNSSRQKVKNLRRSPGYSALILDLTNPYRYVEIRGDVRIEPDADYAFADRVGAKYGSDLREMDRPGESRVIVTLQPDRVRIWG